MPEKSSRKAALEKLSRSQLIEIIFTLQQHEQNLVKERDSLKQLLARQGSAGAATNSVPGIVEHAQQAAEKCLESVRDMNEKAQEANNQIIEAAERQAAAILQDAELQAQHILNTASVKARELEASALVLPEDFDMLLDDIDESLVPDEEYSVPQARDYLGNVEGYPLDYQPQLPYEAQFIEELAQFDSEDAPFDGDFPEDATAFQEDDLLEEFHIRPEDVQPPTVMITIGEEETWEAPEPEEKEEEPKPLSPDLISDFDPMADPDTFLEDYRAALEELMAAGEAAEEPQGELASYLDGIAAERDEVASGEDGTKAEAKPSITMPSLNKADIEKIHAKAEGKSAIEDTKAPEEEAGSEEKAVAEISGDDSQKAEADADIQATTEMPPVPAMSESSEEAPKSYGQSATSIGATEPFEPLDPSISGLLSMTKAERKAAKKAAKKARKTAKRSGNPRLEKMNAEKTREGAESNGRSDPQGSGLQDAGDIEPVKVEEVVEEAVSQAEPSDSAQGTQTQEQLIDHARQVLKTTTVPEIMQSSYESFTSANRIQEVAYSEFDEDTHLDDVAEYKKSPEQDKQGVE